jgi:streptomycin 6-kinase
MGVSRLPSVPEELIRNATELRGTSGAEWVRRLPSLVAECGRCWSLEVGRPFPELSHNWVAPALRADGTAVVLKLSFPEDPEFGSEARALALFDGRGIVRLLELDSVRGAMLLERLQPGAPLDTLEDDGEAMSAAASVLQRLWRPAQEGHSFPTVSGLARDLARLRRCFGGGTGPLPGALVEEAEALLAWLVPSQNEQVLLHADIHHGNILSARREPWLAIDPKGVVGEKAYDAGALLYNPTELLDAPRPSQILKRRIGLLSEELGLDCARVHGWGLSRAVLAAYWSFQEGGEVWEAALAFAGLLSAL